MDLKKAIQQHLEMDDFFTGGFAVKGQNSHELTRMNTNKKTNNKLVQIRENSWQKTGHRLKSKFLGSLVGTGARHGGLWKGRLRNEGNDT